ncbi:MAG: hemolysin family protein [Candidatus Omnitrophica bacterium]|nr:hemolysin family protein [Candidatus Omnitrophota bacterium]
MHPIFLPWPITIIVLIILGVVSFIFSAAETSIISLSRIRLRHMLARGMKRANNIHRLVDRLDKFITAILVGNNFVNIAISAIVTGICIAYLGYEWGIIWATLITGFTIVIICEITPKIIAIKHTERDDLALAPLMEAFIKVFAPVIAVFSWSSNIIIRVLGIKPTKKSPLITEEELRLMIEMGKEEGFLSDEKGRMLHRIFEFGNITVADVMVQADKMIAININSTPEDLLNVFVEEGHARLPVYKDTRDNIVGIIYARDLLYILRDKGLFLLQDIVHEAYFIQPKMRVNELLRRFQTDHVQIAVVLDEHKKAIGLVTLEDLIEEIVGEIEDKHSRKRKN